MISTNPSLLVNFAAVAAALTGIAAIRLRTRKAPKHPGLKALQDLSDKIVDTFEERTEALRPQVPGVIPAHLPIAQLYGEAGPNGYRARTGLVFLSKDETRLILVKTDEKFRAKKNNTFYLTTSPAHYIDTAPRFRCSNGKAPFNGFMADAEKLRDQTQRVSLEDLDWVKKLLRPTKPSNPFPAATR